MQYGMQEFFIKGLSNFNKPTVVNYSRQKNFNNKDSFMKPSINGKEYISKFRGQKFDHNGKEKFRSQNELKKNLICFGCKKPGHKISQCRLNNNNNNYKQYRNTRRVNMVEEVNNDSDNRKENPEYVLTCDTGNLLYISATIDGITLTMALDSGCTTSILSRKFVERNKITVKESDIRIKTADNNIVKQNCKLVGKTIFLGNFNNNTTSSEQRISYCRSNDTDVEAEEFQAPVFKKTRGVGKIYDPQGTFERESKTCVPGRPKNAIRALIKHVGYGQDKSVHYTEGFLRSFGRSNFWIAKINGLKYTDGLKNGLKNTGVRPVNLVISNNSSDQLVAFW
ncbi:hypothetical protein BpHYR1_035295 [Brachionus plicatilis]|uniref:CCHC-type domain-containing protein n=1 Tax=Brachionus plicatilis TaxID=10195 RepID=A0A3M7RU83_BRAPC|nr:hypothetical protein BpHYR1_035295 [Brachionus plicatilis]